MSKFSNILNRLERFPVAMVGTTVGAITLSNAYAFINLNFLRTVFMIMGIFVFILATIKLIHHHGTFIKEYQTPVAGSLYATYAMLLVLIGSFIFGIFPVFGKILCYIGFVLHAITIILFTYFHVHRHFKIETFLPCWFATYIGILVLTVVGKPLNLPTILSNIIVFYGMGIYIVMIPFLIHRLLKHPIEHGLRHMTAIILAPPSMCIISYLNFFETPNINLVIFIYFILFISLIYVVANIPHFFSTEFQPGFGGTTFPMAIGTVGSLKVSAFLIASGHAFFGSIIFSLAQIQLYLTTAIIGVVLFNFFKKIYHKK
ncbi:MAG: TDT family transporter [Fusobacteriaceae bacterium]